MRRRIRLGIIGVGNCASALLQGLAHYRTAAPDGLMRETIGGYHVADVDVAVAFDVAENKVGRPLIEAAFAAPNNTLRFSEAIAGGDLRVLRGPTLDGFGPQLAGWLRESAAPAVDVAAALMETRTDVLVSYLPVGSERASAHYAEAALKAGCGFVNCIPVFLASNPAWARRFEARGLPILGDDVKSQFGATIVHRALVDLLGQRGLTLGRSYQLNVGGNADFRNMLDRDRLASKKASKTGAVASLMRNPPSPDDLHVGPSDYVPWLADRKVAFIRVEAEGFGGAQTTVELRLEVWDSPNSAGVVTDAVRVVKLAMDRSVGGALEGPSAWLMKSPPRPMPDGAAAQAMDAFIGGRA